MAKEEGFLEVSGLAVMARQCLCLSVGIRKAEVRYYHTGGGGLHPHWLLRARRGWVVLVVGPTAHVPAPKARDLQGWASPACLRLRGDRFSARGPINTTGGVSYGAFHLEHAPCSMQQVTLNPMRN